MSKFANQLINMVPFGVDNKRIVYLDLTYLSDLCDYDIVVPEGFPYDGASVPGFFSRLYPKFGKKYDYAACVHDYLCEKANLLKGTEHYGPARKFADDVFMEIMELAGVSWWRRKTMYAAVRSYGKGVEYGLFN